MMMAVISSPVTSSSSPSCIAKITMLRPRSKNETSVFRRRAGELTTGLLIMPGGRLCITRIPTPRIRLSLSSARFLFGAPVDEITDDFPFPLSGPYVPYATPEHGFSGLNPPYPIGPLSRRVRWCAAARVAPEHRVVCYSTASKQGIETFQIHMFSPDDRENGHASPPPRRFSTKFFGP